MMPCDIADRGRLDIASRSTQGRREIQEIGHGPSAFAARGREQHPAPVAKLMPHDSWTHGLDTPSAPTGERDGRWRCVSPEQDPRSRDFMRDVHNTGLPPIDR